MARKLREVDDRLDPVQVALAWAIEKTDCKNDHQFVVAANNLGYKLAVQDLGRYLDPVVNNRWSVAALVSLAEICGKLGVRVKGRRMPRHYFVSMAVAGYGTETVCREVSLRLVRGLVRRLSVNDRVTLAAEMVSDLNSELEEKE